MKRLKITHRTAYYYNAPVFLGAHRALIWPREGHDVHIETVLFTVQPTPTVRWIRDIYGNSIALMTFEQPTQELSVSSEILVSHYVENPVDFLIDPNAIHYPFQYSAEEQVELIPYLLASYPRDSAALGYWLGELYTPGTVINTFELLDRLNTRIYRSLQYLRREEPGVQSPLRTIELGGGSCRDYAVLLMEAARYWGFGARFVTGYIRLEQGEHGATHAWTEIYIPGAGWRGFDPTNETFVGWDHVSVAVARDAEKACPLSGVWEGPSEAFDRMEVSVQVVEV